MSVAEQMFFFKDVTAIYLLIRPKRGHQVKERLKQVLESQVKNQFFNRRRIDLILFSFSSLIRFV